MATPKWVRPALIQLDGLCQELFRLEGLAKNEAHTRLTQRHEGELSVVRYILVPGMADLRQEDLVMIDAEAARLAGQFGRLPCIAAVLGDIRKQRSELAPKVTSAKTA